MPRKLAYNKKGNIQFAPECLPKILSATFKSMT